MTDYKIQTTPVDWSRPIQFANGRPCRLLETNPDGTHVIRREDVDGITAVWTMPPDGSQSPGTLGYNMGMWIVNRDDDLT